MRYVPKRHVRSTPEAPVKGLKTLMKFQFLTKYHEFAST
ncbi:hypothetical protein RHECNPAF_3500044 [Rhizobium etli CNPAF512]|nr:hypothetical protein RHECNPAF_3500044 [Rhizobium etli CNPAF512]